LIKKGEHRMYIINHLHVEERKSTLLKIKHEERIQE